MLAILSAIRRPLNVAPSKSTRNAIAAPMATPSQTYRHRFRLLVLWESPVSQPLHRLVLTGGYPQKLTCKPESLTY
jgi:hypothetical protein